MLVCQRSSFSSDLRKQMANIGYTQKNDSDVLWNFEKLLINRNGEVVVRFEPDIPVTDPRVQQAIEKQLVA